MLFATGAETAERKFVMDNDELVKQEEQAAEEAVAEEVEKVEEAPQPTEAAPEVEAVEAAPEAEEAAPEPAPEPVAEPEPAPQYTEPAPAPAQKSGSSFGWAVLGFFIPLAGLILFLVWGQTRPEDAKAAGKGALISVIISAIGYALMMCAAGAAMIGAGM